MTSDCFDTCWTCCLQEEEMFEDDGSGVVFNESSVRSSSQALALPRRGATTPLACLMLPLSCYLAKLVASGARELCQHTGDCNVRQPRTNRRYKVQRVRYRYSKAHSTPSTPTAKEKTPPVDSNDGSSKKSQRAFWARMFHCNVVTNKICSCVRRRARGSRSSSALDNHHPTSERQGDAGLFDLLKRSSVLNPFQSSPDEAESQSTTHTKDSDMATIHEVDSRDDSEKQDGLSALRTKTSLGDRLRNRRRTRKQKSNNKHPKVQFFPAYHVNV